ncbi:MAG: hypothetical protein RR225_00665 [Clostridium sp.]
MANKNNYSDTENCRDKAQNSNQNANQHKAQNSSKEKSKNIVPDAPKIIERDNY